MPISLSLYKAFDADTGGPDHGHRRRPDLSLEVACPDHPAADLLILDDFGLEPLDAGTRHDLLEILEERYGRRSTIVTSQLPLSAWHEVIGDPTYADAILDRLVHNAHRIELTGESLRRARGKQSKTA
jgi:DNA replication protein DnaC